MTIDNKVFPFECKGRDQNSRECLLEYVKISVDVYKKDSILVGDVTCPHYFSEKGQCRAGNGHCPYDFAIPSTLGHDKRKGTLQW